MSFYLPVMFTLILNAFMLLGLDSEIQINITLGLAYSMFLFLYYLARKREADTTLLLSALAYWALLSFVLNAQSTVFIFNNELFIFSLIFNLFAALLIFVAVLRIATNLLISPLPLLLMSHSLLAVMMYFSDLSLYFFIYIYIASMLLLALLNYWIFNKEESKFNFSPFLVIWFVTFSLFFLNEITTETDYHFSVLQNYNYMAMFTALVQCVFSFTNEIFTSCYNLDVLAEGKNVPASSFSTKLYNAMWKSGRASTTSVSGWGASTKPLYGWRPSTAVTQETISNSRAVNFSSSFTSHFQICWTRLNNFVGSFIKNSSENPEALKLIKEQPVQKTASAALDYKNDVSSLSIINYVSNSRSNLTINSLIAKEVFHLFSSVGSRAYATIPTPTLKDSNLFISQFDILEDSKNTLCSKIEKLSIDEFCYAFINQKYIPILEGSIGGHPSFVLLISDESTYDFLCVLTASPGIAVDDSTYSEKNKIVHTLKGSGGKRTSNQELINKLLWEKQLKEYDEQPPTQKLAPTFFRVTKEVSAEIREAGMRADSGGTAKIQSMSEELRRELIILIDRSRLDSDPSKIKVVTISKKVQ